MAALVLAAAYPPPDPLGGEPPGPLALLKTSRSLPLLLNSLALAIAVTIPTVVIGTWLAWAQARLDYPGRRALGLAALLPLAVPSYVLAAVVAQSFGPGGWIGKPLGLPRIVGFPAATFVLIIATIPYVQLIVGAALNRSSGAEEEAARSLGAGPWRVFTAVVLPRIRPAAAFAGLLSLLYVVSDFGAVAVLDMPVLTWRLYQAVAGQDLARAALLGIAVLVVTIPLFAAARWVHGRRPPSDVANPRPPARRKSTLAQSLVTYSLLAVVIGVGVLLPITTMGAWVLDGIRRELPFAAPWTPLLSTLAVSALGAVIILLLSFWPAWQAARGAERPAWLTDQAVFLTGALPGVLLAFGWIVGALGLARGLGRGALYGAIVGSGVLLFAGYALRFLSEVYTPLKTSVLRLDKRQEESARALGVGRTRWFFRIATPALAPGTAAALLLGFLAILKELPITLLLGGPTGLQTLAFRVWDRYEEALWHDAGVAGLLLVALALAAVAATLPWRRHA